MKKVLADILGDVFITNVQNPTKSKRQIIMSEVQNYQDEVASNPMPLLTDPLVWWKVNEHKFPHVSTYAKILLPAQGTSVASERVFSTAGDTVTAQRSRLNPDCVDQLIFLKKNRKLCLDDN